MCKKMICPLPPFKKDRLLPVDTGSLESGDTETCLLVETSPGHQGPLAHPAPKNNTISSITFNLVYKSNHSYMKLNTNQFSLKRIEV